MALSPRAFYSAAARASTTVRVDSVGRKFLCFAADVFWCACSPIVSYQNYLSYSISPSLATVLRHFCVFRRPNLFIYPSASNTSLELNVISLRGCVLRRGSVQECELLQVILFLHAHFLNNQLLYAFFVYTPSNAYFFGCSSERELELWMDSVDPLGTSILISSQNPRAV